ncbi:alanine racemase [Legionella fallonii]|uniref:Alanine racemase n=1 Tax=Legionella fallonii LLAP-10 TaxID=1212491 RepID=A0A098G4R1_9GAMM|nr:alanine racemase [Legionella fallonii]CEG57478.1 alanine racemase 1, PLP-binding, biosynthetic [Legionella fallonii LLAP-10]
MSRPTKILIDHSALVHNLEQIKRFAPNKQIYAMVKANAYGCGISEVVPVLDGRVDAFGVACLEEALAIRAMGSRTQCMLNQGVFSQEEYNVVAQFQFACIIHHAQQLRWLLNNPTVKPINIWVKVNTGMHRLGFKTHELPEVMHALTSCSWVDKQIGLMSHFACSDQPERAENEQQMALFQEVNIPGFALRSMANSAAIISFPQVHVDVIRPGIMLYGVSPFASRNASELGLRPVMHFVSAISAIHHNPPLAQVGYGGTWSSHRPSIIGVVPVGYGDGYPRHIAANTPVWIKGREVPVVGRVSMDMLTVDLTDHPEVQIGDAVELWGAHIAVERVAQSAGTIGYELLCQITDRVR